ncbi:MAG: UvrABC system protein [Planctomycetota bacterium]
MLDGFIRLASKSSEPRSGVSAATHVVVKGAREHNLKNVDLAFPRDSLTTFTGVSGSGKSSLAYHTVYQEGQRRFLESLSSYARQFLGRMEKPKVDLVEGLSPTVSIDQKSTSHAARSTVGTLTEVMDFLRLLWSRLGVPACPECGALIEAWSADRITDAILVQYENKQAMVLAPVVRERKGEYRKELDGWRAKGFVRARIDGVVRRLDEEIKLDRYVYHTIELVVDRLTLQGDARSRLAEAVEQALSLGDGLCAIAWGEDGHRLFSARRSCPAGHGSLPEMEPRLFSFNSPIGACPKCDGLGETHGFSVEAVVSDPRRTLRDGALQAFTPDGRLVYGKLTLDHLAEVGRAEGFDLDTPWHKLPAKARKVVLHGSGDRLYDFRWTKQGVSFRTTGRDRIAWPGVLRHLEACYRPSRARHLDRFRSATPCDACEGTRLGPQARAVRFEGRSLPEVLAFSVDDALAWVRAVRLEGNALLIGRDILAEVERRLGFLAEVGLSYLTLERRANTLSGGESQRIRLAAQVGAGLRGILYVLDEPSIGLHARDQERLLRTLEALRDRGNTVVVVEHDQETMERSDFLVDVGPGAGTHGGTIVAAGTPAEVKACKASATGKYLKGELRIESPAVRRSADKGALRVRGATHHNLKGIDVEIPLGRFVAVAGVSGSGKSTLVHHVLKPSLGRVLNGSNEVPGACDGVEGIELLDKVVEIDQAPIGRTPRSNPATYTDVWTHVRDLYSMLPESRLRQYEKGRFSFNVPGGRCEACEGAGVQVLEMNFLAPVEVVCEECGGARFHAETLQVRFQGRSVHDVLEMTVDEAANLFANLPKVARGLRMLQRVGLGYLKLGQPSTTLSGGEAQRIKLAAELQRPATGKTLYILDEPTTGLHFSDVQRLLECLQELVDAGNTVLVIEHNVDVIRCADWVLELGPEGGAGGGLLVAKGTPEQVASVPGSATAEALLHAGVVPATRVKRAKVGVARSTAGRALRTEASKQIEVRGARTHNLKGVDVDVPHGRFTVVTGVSGSGKSSLAFDTIFQEGQRRFLESMSTYARRFLGRMDRAPADRIDGLGPAIAIDQKQGSRSPRSTVATTTEIHDHLRLLYARVGRPHCPVHRTELVAWAPGRVAAHLLEHCPGRKVWICAPMVLPAEVRVDAAKRQVWLAALVHQWRQSGFVRVLWDGAERRLDQELPGGVPAQLDLVVDRVSVTDRNRIVDAVEQAYAQSKEHDGVAMSAVVLADGADAGRRLSFASERRCIECGFTGTEQPHPRFFSFNHHSGACPSCAGLGEVVVCDPDLMVNHPTKPVFAGAIAHPGHAWTFLTRRDGWYADVAAEVAERHGFDLDTPWQSLPERARTQLLRGTGDERYEVVFRKYESGRSRTWRMSVPWKGLARQVEEWFHGREGEHSGDDRLRHVMRIRRCPDCDGERLQPAQRFVTVGGVRMPEICSMTVAAAHSCMESMRLTAAEKQIASEVLKEVRNRLTFLRDVGLGYLTLDRSAATLSGGEAQRIRLATQLGNRLMGVLYVLDEPTVGLHPRDTDRLLRTLLDLRDLGNTVLAVEHDERLVRAADHVVDMGPLAGSRGGRVVAAGTVAAVSRGDSPTARWLRGEISVPQPAQRRSPLGHVALSGLMVHNLVDLSVRVPLGVFCAVTGVSGSGKSSLVMDGLVPLLRSGSAPVQWRDGRARDLRLMVVGQEPIGTTPSSNPATYSGVFGPIRELFSQAPLARQKGFGAGRFSFNVAEGRCSACDGKGQIQVEMHFLADVWVTCETCRGRRYNAETLQVEYRSRNIAQVLDMEVDEALAFFANHPRIARPLQLLADVGLGYLRLGQSATTFSGGEAQRIKLVAELTGRARDHAVYVLDEPTTGLHMADVEKLVTVLQRLVDRGNSVVVIEHHLEVIRAADHVVELGPEAGDEGGKVVAEGTPADLVAAGTHTGRCLDTGAKPGRPGARRSRQEDKSMEGI